VKKSSVFSILALVMVLMPCMGSGGETERLYVIERDTLQTRNFTPIINHETMLFNLGDRPLSLELNSSIPAGKFVKGKYYPAFLEESLLPDPLFSPIEVAPKKTSYLAKPEIKTAGDKTTFVWKKVASTTTTSASLPCTGPRTVSMSSGSPSARAIPPNARPGTTCCLLTTSSQTQLVVSSAISCSMSLFP
jgi:hypothetical protein